MIKKDILFDLDDTIVKLNGSKEISVNLTLNFFISKNNLLNFSKDYIRNARLRYDERDIFKLIKLILIEFNIDVSLEKIKDKFLSTYKDVALKNEKLMIDEKVLKKLNEKYNLTIITNRPRIFFDIIWKDRLKPYFQNVVCFDDYENIPRKPNFLVITNAIEKLNLNAEFYVGNEEHDILASNGANLKCILISNDNKKEYSVKPTYILGNINEIEKIFL